MNEPINDITYADQLKQIQAQLAVLETSYANMTRTYYDMFYNSTPMDITLQIYDTKGALKTITVPNRAKSSTSAKTCIGSPAGVVEAAMGTFIINTVDNSLWYKTSQNGTDGWVQLANVNTLSDEFLKKNGNGELLQHLNASHIDGGTLDVAFGGTGVSNVDMSGILKMVPQVTAEDGTITKAHIEIAESGVDYLNTATLAGMIVFFPVNQIQAGYLICNGDSYSKKTYANLYKFLTNDGAIPCPFGEDTDTFAVPNLDTYFIRCTTGNDREVMSTQDAGVPNIKGEWSMEITGGEQNFSGSVQIALDDEGRYKQVDGKSSAPSGSYDYLIQFNAKNSSDMYQDDLDEVRVKNIALVPAIKY